MNIKLIRTFGTENETLGYLEINDKKICYTLEDAVRDSKIKEITCIPYGKYKVKVTYSPKFKKKLPLIYNNPVSLNVEAENGDIWSGVRFHGGNTRLDTEGCPLLAYNQYINKPQSFVKNGKSYIINNWIQGSAEKEISELLSQGEHDLEILHIDNLKKETLYRLRNPYMKDDEIGKIQSSLKKLGYKISIDNVFGEQTHKVVWDFQMKNKLKTVDGIVGKETLKALGL